MHRPEIEAILTKAGIKVRSAEIIAPSLEDVFIASAREEYEWDVQGNFTGAAD